MAERDSRLARGDRTAQPSAISSEPSTSPTPTPATATSGGLFSKLFPGRSSTSRQSSSDQISSRSSQGSKERTKSPLGFRLNGAPYDQSATKNAMDASLHLPTDPVSGSERLDVDDPSTRLSIAELVRDLKSPSALKSSTVDSSAPNDKTTSVMQLVKAIGGFYDLEKREEAWREYLDAQEPVALTPGVIDPNSTTNPYEGQHTAEFEAAQDAADRMELLDIARSLIDPFDPFSLSHLTSTSRSTGFALIAQVLTLPSAMPWLKQYQPFSLTTLRYLARLCLTTAADITSSEIGLRISCLTYITHGGQDISLGLGEGMLPKLMAWIGFVGQEWMTSIDALKDIDLQRGRLGSDASVLESGRRVSLPQGHVDASIKDKSIIPGRLPPTPAFIIPRGSQSRVSATSSVTSPSPPGDVMIKLLHFLLGVMRHNLAMFSSSDLATILNLYIKVLWDSLDHSMAAGRGVSSSGRDNRGSTGSDVRPSVQSSSGRGGRDRRSPSVIGRTSSSILSPNSPSRTSAKDRQESVPETSQLNRSASLLRRGGEGGKAPPAQPKTSTETWDHDTPAEDLSAIDTSPDGDLANAKTGWIQIAQVTFVVVDFLLGTRTLPPISVDSIVRVGSTAIGVADHGDLTADFAHLLARMLRMGLVARSTEKAIRNVLEAQGRREEEKLWESEMSFGALLVVRQLLDPSTHIPGSGLSGADTSSRDAMPILSIPTLSPSLAASMTRNRSPSKAISNYDRRSWEQKIDLQVLLILKDFLDRLENQTDEQVVPEVTPSSPAVPVMASSTANRSINQGKARATWVNGEIFCEILDCAKSWLLEYRLPDGSVLPLIRPGDGHRSESPPLLTAYCSILHRLPVVLGACYSNTKSSLYIHPQFAELMLELALHLPPNLAMQIMEYYEVEGLCMPLSNDWIENIWKILRSFYFIPDARGLGASASIPDATVRRRAAKLLYQHVWSYVGDFSDYRAILVDAVILPLQEQTLLHESDEFILKSAMEVLVEAASLETIEREEEKRKARSDSKDRRKSSTPFEPQKDSPRTFERVRKLLLILATSSPCDNGEALMGAELFSRPGPVTESDISVDKKIESHIVSAKEEPKDLTSSGILGFVGSLSPNFSRPKELPSISATTASVLPPDGVEHPAVQQPQANMIGLSYSAKLLPSSQRHSNCKSHNAILALIAVFSRLAFSPPQSLLSTSTRVARLPASTRCITIFKDLLRLLAPTASHRYTGSSVSGLTAVRPNIESMLHAQCPQARLAVLQWLMRLRADKQHRIWVKPALDDAAYTWAKGLSRAAPKEEPLPSQEETIPVAITSARRRPGRPEPPSAETQKPDRGREGRPAANMATGRSPSRNGGRLAQPPLWRIPDTLSFEYPVDGRPSEGMTTYDPALQQQSEEGDATSDGVWLPISEYLKVLVDLLTTETDWNLVSYTLVFLPLQLANKHFFCGPKASNGVRDLRRVVCNGLQDDRLVAQAILPSVIRKTDIRAVAYQTLTIMISYRKLFAKADGDDMIDAFSKGLRDHQDTAIPCVQALTIATFELETHLAKRLPGILPVLSQVMSNPALSIHILELLYAVGNVPVLYGNFRDEHYRLIFKVALAYIQTHNLNAAKDGEDVHARGARRTPAECGPLTLAEHVIGLSYFVIYTWFMVVDLKSRPSYVSELTTQLVLANADPTQLDDRTEVCFDWLARYAYGNADPKPASSFINDLVMDDGGARSGHGASGDGEAPEAKSWLLGGAIISISAKPRSGWATITTRRPSGTVSMLCKIENVPLLTVGEDDADLRIATALMQGDRDQEEMAQPALEALPLISADATAVPVATISIPIPQPSAQHSSFIGTQAHASTSPPPLSPSTSSFPGPSSLDSQNRYVWSGAAPSQRRKDVAIDPSFIAFQLSAYPYPRMTSPRGTLLQNTHALQRTIKNIDRVQVIDHHRIAVLYVGPGQTTEQEIMENTNGSPAYLRFLAGMARLVRLKDQKDVFTGGLDREKGRDGEFAYAWWDDLAHIVYMTSHMMPLEADTPIQTRRKEHLGNCYVRIVFNDSGTDYRFDTISTDFLYVNIVISAHTAGVSGIYDDREEHDFFKVTCQRAPGIPEFSPFGEFKLVSAAALPLLIRQTSLMANIISQVYVELERGTPYISHWRERLGFIRRFVASLPPPESQTAEPDPVQLQQSLRDFTRVLSYSTP